MSIESGRALRQFAWSLSCGAPVVVTAAIAALLIDSDVGDVAFLIVLNSLAVVPLVAAAFLLVRKMGPVRGVVIALAGAATQCVVIWLAWGPLYTVSAGAPLAGFVFVPLWTLLASTFTMLVTGVVAAFWLRGAQPPVECCRGCGYDLAGLVNVTVCPECGGAVRGDSPRASLPEKSQ